LTLLELLVLLLGLLLLLLVLLLMIVGLESAQHEYGMSKEQDLFLYDINTSKLNSTTYLLILSSTVPMSSSWRVEIANLWDVSNPRYSVLLNTHFLIQVLGPFPIHAREQHFLSPAFPLNSNLLNTSYVPRG
jgi:hypothetical protein